MGEGIKYGFYFLYLIMLLYTLFFTIKNLKTIKKSIVSGVLFITLLFLSINFILKNNSQYYKEIKKSLGYYRLENLDNKKCKECKVKLLENKTYDIIVKNKKIGTGNWEIEHAADIPNYYIILENGNEFIFENNRIVTEINRVKNKSIH